MGKKYIAELPDCYVLNRLSENKFLKVPIVLENGDDAAIRTPIRLTPYTEPDLEQVREEAYERGYKTAKCQCNIQAEKDLREVGERHYQAGLSDAWECARKIANMPYDEEEKAFGLAGWTFIAKYTASEAIEKIRQYEQEQEKEKDSEIKVGDEVEWNGDRYVVTYIDVDETYVDVIDCSCGSVCDRLAIKGITKTGRHFPEIAAVLEKIKGAE